MGWSADIDWTSPATLMNAPTHCIRDVYNAYVERSNAIGSTLVSGVSAPSLNGYRAVAYLQEYGLGRLFLASSLRKYVNLNGNDIEDYTGESAMPSAWTVADLETAIGATAPTYEYRDDLGEAGPIAAWVWWWHEALNLMTAIKTEINLSYSNGRQRQGYGGTWAACLSDFAGESWDDVGRAAVKHYGVPGYSATRHRHTYTGNGNASIYFSPAGRYAPNKFTYVAYMKFSKPTGFITTPVYENPEFPLGGEDNYGAVATELTPITTDASGKLQDTVTINDISTVTVSEPTTAARGYESTANHVLMDLAVAGGFEYV